MKNQVKLILMLIAFLLPCIKSFGQGTQFKAMYIYKFAKGVSWPNADNNGGDFVITIVGDNELAAALKKSVGTRKIGSRNIVVLETATIAQLKKSEVIYLGESKNDQIQKLVESQKNNHVLIISGKSGWCQHGACISFVNKNGALAYEVSNKNIQKAGLNCSQEILRSGTNVDQ